MAVFRKILSWCLVLQSLPSFSQTPSISGVINDYAAVTALYCQGVDVNATAGFAGGDKVMLVQMKGATIDSSNTIGFGTILNYNAAGNYEIATISSISGNTITFTDSVLRDYSVSGLVQLVRMPTYTNANVTGVLTCAPWSGATGGVLALVANGNLTLNADIDASGLGFRGGSRRTGSFLCTGDTSDYLLSASSIESSNKGEGIVCDDPARAEGKGSNANGGGAGNDINGGGAGGGNYGAGGHGGDIKSSSSCPTYVYLNSGGIGGRNLAYSNLANKIFLGGGAGAGQENDNLGTAGAAGGGIVLIMADTIFGNNNYIRSDGATNLIVAGYDGQGGGGAGGTILLSVANYNAVDVSVRGGNGGTDNFTGPDCHGKGGGGGVIWKAGAIATGITPHLIGGSALTYTNSNSVCYGTTLGAANGQGGGVINDLIIPQSNAPCSLSSVHTGSFENVSIYPNPVSDRLHVTCPEVIKSLKVENLLGEKIATTETIVNVSGNKASINTRDLSNGMYIVKIQGSHTITRKVLVQH